MTEMSAARRAWVLLVLCACVALVFFTFCSYFPLRAAMFACVSIFIGIIPVVLVTMWIGDRLSVRTSLGIGLVIATVSLLAMSSDVFYDSDASQESIAAALAVAEQSGPAGAGLAGVGLALVTIGIIVLAPGRRATRPVTVPELIRGVDGQPACAWTKQSAEATRP